MGSFVDALMSAVKATDPGQVEFHQAVREFKDRIPELARGLMDVIARERGANKAFVAAFGQFHDLYATALNPAIAAEAIEEMLVQHLLTERLFRTIFETQDFTRRNAIAAEIETVIDALTSRVFKDYPEPMRYAGVTMCAIFFVGLLVLPFAPETKGKPLPE